MAAAICDLFTFQHLQTLFIKIVKKNAYYSQKSSTTSCSFLKSTPASTNGCWFFGCHLTSLAVAILQSAA